jgi:hypothetical protein
LILFAGPDLRDVPTRRLFFQNQRLEIGVFQLPAAAFPVRACVCGNFFEQKVKLAGAEQT